MHGRSRKMTLFTVILFQQITIISMYVRTCIHSKLYVCAETHTHTRKVYVINSNNNVCYSMKSVDVGEEEEDE